MPLYIFYNLIGQQYIRLKIALVFFSVNCNSVLLLRGSNLFLKVQDSGSKLKTSANILDFPLYQPKDILEHLTLPPPKDLEVLLQDAAKPAAASRNNSDLRLGKPVSHRGCLPPFSWSNASSGHCKSNSDAVKLSTSRTTCQGRWVKIENPITSLETTSCFLSELKSLTYDHSLVPSECQKLVPVRNEKDSPKSVSITEQGLLSSTCPVDPQASPGKIYNEELVSTLSFNHIVHICYLFI